MSKTFNFKIFEKNFQMLLFLDSFIFTKNTSFFDFGNLFG